MISQEIGNGPDPRWGSVRLVFGRVEPMGADVLTEHTSPATTWKPPWWAAFFVLGTVSKEVETSREIFALTECFVTRSPVGTVTFTERVDDRAGHFAGPRRSHDDIKYR